MTLQTQQLLVLLCAVMVSAFATSFVRPIQSPSPPADQPPFMRFLASRAGNPGRQIACTAAEKQCFNEKKLLHAGDGLCYAPGERGPCAQGELFHADKEEFLRQGGHLRGTCRSPCAAPGHAPVAATGDCKPRDDVEDEICQSDKFLRATFDIFGQWVCQWTHLPCKPPEQNFFPSTGDDIYNGLCYDPEVLKLNYNELANVTVLKDPSQHPLMFFFKNTSVLQREFACSEEESQCLRYGRLLGNDGKCYSPGQWSGRCEPGQTFHVDKEEAAKEDGKLKGTCASPCKDFKQPQVNTGKCVDFMSMTEVCKWEWGMQSEPDEFGQMTCACGWPSYGSKKPPPMVTPPSSGPGLCRAPDFSKPVRAPTFLDNTLTVGFKVPCSEEEYACLQQGKVLAQGACHTLRTRGPCAEGEELVLDKDALAEARLHAKCASAPCPEGSVQLPIDGACFTHDQVVKVLCPGDKVTLDEFGGWQCGFEDSMPGNLTSVQRNAEDGSCTLPEKYPSFGGPVGFGGAPGAPGAPHHPGPPPPGAFAGGPSGFSKARGA